MQHPSSDGEKSQRPGIIFQYFEYDEELSKALGYLVAVVRDWLTDRVLMESL